MRAVSAVVLAIAFSSRVLGAKPSDTIPVLLSHTCTRQQLMNHGDGTWYFIKYHLDHRSSLNDQSKLSEEELGQAVTAVMSRRFDRLVYVAADPRLPWGDVLHLVSGLTHDDPTLHVALLTEKQTGRFVSFNWRKFADFCLTVPRT
jgi:biopolymer transport protein ExbD